MIIIPNTVRALIFDLDGTLMDSVWLWKAIDRDYLGKYGIEVPADLDAGIGGVSIHEVAVYFRERFHITDPVDQMIDEWNRMAWDKYANEVFPKPGAEALLRQAHARGVACSIASSNSRELVEMVLRRRGMEQDFAYVVTGSEVHRGKPQPDIYLLAMRELGVQPQECIVFEDLVPGIQAGKAAGARVICVDDASSRQDLPVKRRLADAVIADFTEVRF